MDRNKVGALLQSLPEPFGLNALMADAGNIDYYSICSLLKSEIKHRKAHALVDETKDVIPAAWMAVQTIFPGTEHARTYFRWYC